MTKVHILRDEVDVIKYSERAKVISIGFFDGIHKGHQELIKKTIKKANEQKIESAVLTFDHHPEEIVFGRKDKKFITPYNEKLKKLKEYGLDTIYVIHFSKKVSNIPHADFIQKYLMNLNVKHVVVGFDFTFGHKGIGNVSYLVEEGKVNEFGVSIIPKKSFNNEKISSTIIRKMIRNGQFELMPYYLGRNYSIYINIKKVLGSHIVQISTDPKLTLPTDGTYNIVATYEDITTKGYFKISGENMFLILDNAISNKLNDMMSVRFLSKSKHLTVENYS